MPEEPTDAAIEAELADAPDAAWAALWQAVEGFEADPEPARAGGGDLAGALDADLALVSMPQVAYSETVHTLVRALGEVGAIVSFSWMEWSGTDRYRRGTGIDAGPVADAARLLTATVRADQLLEGSLATAIHDGTLTAALDRLRSWFETERPR